MGHENPIRIMDKIDLVDALSVVLPLCAELYCGIHKNEFNENVLVESISFIQDNYSNIGVMEIKQAFELGAANKLKDVNMNAYYGRFNISMLGDILSGYLIERNKLLNQILDAYEKSKKLENYQHEIDYKNHIARENVVNDFKAEIEKKKSGKEMKIKNWDDVPLFYPRILIDRGIIKLPDEVKRDLWDKAKQIVLNETRYKATDFSNLYEAKSAKNLLKSFESSSTDTFKQKAEVIYGKLYVWEFLK